MGPSLLGRSSWAAPLSASRTQPNTLLTSLLPRHAWNEHGPPCLGTGRLFVLQKLDDLSWEYSGCELLLETCFHLSFPDLLATRLGCRQNLLLEASPRPDWEVDGRFGVPDTPPPDWDVGGGPGLAWKRRAARGHARSALVQVLDLRFFLFGLKCLGMRP